jgi:serine protease AprX
MRRILIILCFFLTSITRAQMYRVFYHEPATPFQYISIIKGHCDSVWMTSTWLNYSLVEMDGNLNELLQYSFVDRVEKVVPLRAIPLQENFKDSIDPAVLDEHRQWQLDTMGYKYFEENKLDGKGIVIAIIDAGFTGADESKAFKKIFDEGRVLKTWDFIDNDTTVFDGSTHGTGVWSCIAGDLDGKQTGLATGASFILLRSEDQKTETMADEDRWIMAIEKAYELGADVVNSSIGFSNVLHKRSDLNGQSLISKAAQIATEKGMVVVMSAGNEWVTAWKTISIPADAEGVISVGAIDKQGRQTYFSSVGPTADGRLKPDMVAPGVCVVVKGNSLVMANGTSFASPLVAGYVACMLQQKGKNNFNRDSIKVYGGLYPYFDYVFGYGVPGTKNYFSEYGTDAPCNGFEVDKLNSTIKRIIYCGSESTLKHVFVKVEDETGRVKFSKVINIPSSGIYKVPTSTKAIKFYYGKNYNPKSTDKWTIRFSDFTVEY